MGAPTNLAKRDFWEEDYYRGIDLPARPDPNYPYERCLMRTLEELAPVSAGARVLEVGCAPARWLVWYAERFGARVTGLEYSAKGAALSRANLSAGGVDGEIIEGDFISQDVVLDQFDLVLSLGVIEHFDDVPAAFARHAMLVDKGGKLVLGVPNFRGLIGIFQRWADREYLALHNQRAMAPQLYKEIVASHGLRLERVRYFDGIDPDMVRATRVSARVALMPLRLWRKLKMSDHVNGRFISAYVVLTFTRP